MNKMELLKKGVKLKIDRGQNINDILDSYVKLSEEEKQIILDWYNSNI